MPHVAPKSIRLMLADDHPIVVEGLKRYFQTCVDIEVVATVAEGQLVKENVSKFKPEVLVLDLNLPGLHGFQVLQEVSSVVNTIVYSMHDDSMHQQKAFKLGAKAHIGKSRPPQDLADAVRQVCQGAVLQETDAPKVPLPVFSQREQQVFELLVAGSIPSQIATKLGVSVSTVHTYSDRLKMKLGVDTIPQLVGYAYRNGMVIQPLC